MSKEDAASGALAGAGTGAAIGSFGGPMGALIGGGLGALGGGALGWFAGKKRDNAQKQSQSAILQARADLEKLAAQQRTQREADLQQALSFFGPVQAEMTRLYGNRPMPGAAPPPRPPMSAAAMNPLRTAETMMAPAPLRGRLR